VKAVVEALDVSRSYQYERRKGCMRVNHYKKKEDERPTYGYRRITAVLNRMLRKNGESEVNHKRVYRIMKINNLLLQKHTGRPVKLHTGTIIKPRSNTRWCSDVFEIACWNKERVRVAFSMDCVDREVLSFIATTGGIHQDIIKDLMTEAIEYRSGKVIKLPHPVQWLSDNAPAYIAQATRNFALSVGIEVCTTPYYSPESNGMAEAFVKTFKRDYVRMHELPYAVTVMKQLPHWFEDYNEYHPHKGLQMMSPREYKKLIERIH